MHAKFVALSALFTLVAAGGYGPPTGNNNNNTPDHPNHDSHNGQNKPVNGKCNVGEMQCCNSVKSGDDQGVTSILSLLGIGAGGVTGMVGLTCSPISAIAIGGNNCNAQPVCCENNNFNGVVALGCNPINAGL